MKDKKYFIELQTPSKIQMLSAVKGHDRQTERRPLRKLIIGLTLLIAGIYALFLMVVTK